MRYAVRVDGQAYGFYFGRVTKQKRRGRGVGELKGEKALLVR